MTKFGHACDGGAGPGPCTGGWGRGSSDRAGALWGGGGKHTDTTENITFPQLCWWALIMSNKFKFTNFVKYTAKQNSSITRYGDQ